MLSIISHINSSSYFNQSILSYKRNKQQERGKFSVIVLTILFDTKYNEWTKNCLYKQLQNLFLDL